MFLFWHRSQESQKGESSHSALISFQKLSRTQEGKYTGSAREKLIQFYTDYNPLKVESVDKTLEKYVSKEEALFNNLAKRYNVQPAVSGIGVSSTAFVSSEGGAFALYAGGTHTTFGSLATPKDKAQSRGFELGRGTWCDGVMVQPHKRRTTITSLKTHADDLRASSDCDSDVDMECN